MLSSPTDNCHLSVQNNVTILKSVKDKVIRENYMGIGYDRNFPLSRQFKVPIILDPVNKFSCFLFCDVKLGVYCC